MFGLHATPICQRERNPTAFGAAIVLPRRDGLVPRTTPRGLTTVASANWLALAGRMGNGSHRIDKTDDLIKALVVIPLGSRPGRVGRRSAMWRVLNKRRAAEGPLGNGIAALV